jgi:hypothetical protein
VKREDVKREDVKREEICNGSKSTRQRRFSDVSIARRSPRVRLHVFTFHVFTFHGTTFSGSRKMGTTIMKTGRWLLAAAALLCTGLPAVLAADAPTPPAATATDEPGKVKKTELHEHMETIEESMKKLRRTIRKADGTADSLDLIARIEQEALVCKGMVPSRAATLPEAERQKFLNAYRKDMAGFITQVLQLESAVIDGDADKAMALYKGLKTVEDDSHDKYMQQDEKDKAKADSK